MRKLFFIALSCLNFIVAFPPAIEAKSYLEQATEKAKENLPESTKKLKETPKELKETATEDISKKAIKKKDKATEAMEEKLKKAYEETPKTETTYQKK